jgi:hypothetical protein
MVGYKKIYESAIGKSAKYGHASCCTYNKSLLIRCAGAPIAEATQGINSCYFNVIIVAII